MSVGTVAPNPIPAQQRKIKKYMKLGENADESPNTEVIKIPPTKMTFLPNLSDITPPSVAPIIIPKNTDDPHRPACQDCNCQ